MRIARAYNVGVDKAEQGHRQARARQNRSGASRNSGKVHAVSTRGAAQNDSRTTRRPARKPPPQESDAERVDRARQIVGTLHQLYPQAECALHHENALQLLAATILSAQCTDTRVNQVTRELFRTYRTARDFAEARPAALEAAIESTGFFRNKAKNLIGMGKTLVEKFGGQVPGTMEELLQLPGVARKTAYVVLGTWFKKNEGVVVDTHIGRLACRLQLTDNARDEKDAVRIEQDLMTLLPREEWTFVGHALIWHGRKVCAARKPKCEECALAGLCPSAGRFP